MTKLCLSYAGYADFLNGQFGGPAFARPVPLMDGVLGFFARDEPRLVSFHIEHFQGFKAWKCLRGLLGEEAAGKVHELHQKVSSLELPRLSRLSEDELRTTMQQSVVRREFEISWPDDPEVAERLRGIVHRWDTGIYGRAGS